MWITLQASDIENAMAPAEQVALPASNAYLTNLLYGITQYITGFAQTWGPNRAYMGPAANPPTVPVGTIPDEVYNEAVVLVRYKLIASLPGTTLITRWREEERREAIDTIKDLATGKLRIQGYPPGSGIPEIGANWNGEIFFEPYSQGEGWQANSQGQPGVPFWFPEGWW